MNLDRLSALRLYVNLWKQIPRLSARIGGRECSVMQSDAVCVTVRFFWSNFGNKFLVFWNRIQVIYELEGGTPFSVPISLGEKD